jgi:hypothetical protein
MFITVYNAIKEQLSTVAPLQWHRGSSTPVQTPGIIFELPKEISWEQDPERVLSARAPLSLHLVTDAPVSADEPVQAEDLRGHFAMADMIMSLLNEMEISDDEGRTVACYFLPGPTKPAVVESGLVKTILTFDVDWRSYALINTYKSFNPDLDLTGI